MEAVRVWRIVDDLGDGAADPYTGRPLTQDQEWAAYYGYVAFESVLGDKKTAIKAWMNGQQGGKLSTDEAYSQFRNKYMVYI